MLIAKIENGQVINVSDYREMFPNTSFPSSGTDKDFLEANSCLPVCLFKSYDPLTEKLSSVSPYIEDGQVFTVAVEPLTTEEIASNTELQWAKIRSQRDSLLTACDWTQLPDVTIPNKAAWAAYRQELRDITSQADPYNIVWPTNPNEGVV